MPVKFRGWVCLCLCTAGFAQEIPLQVRTFAGGGRVEILAEDALLLQRLGQWVNRALPRLEKEWNLTLPGEPSPPLRLRVTPETAVCRLVELPGQGGGIRQEIWLPADPDAQHWEALAEALTRAMALRLIRAALPPASRGLEVHAPDWLVIGSAPWLFPPLEISIAARAAERYRHAAPPVPAVIVHAAKTDRSEMFPVDAHLLCRWLFQRREGAEAPGRDWWAAFASAKAPRAEDWRGLRPEAGNLREFHILWELEWREERLRLIAAFGLVSEALELLLRELETPPARYGLGEAADRYAASAPIRWQIYLEDPRLPHALRQWTLRVQGLRIRQGADFTRLTDPFLAAVSSLSHAASLKGAKQQQRIEQAQAQWREGEAGLGDFLQWLNSQTD
jgi:hypothetical protein